jgi:hypothetical protein
MQTDRNPMPPTWNRAGLQGIGFCGFVPLLGLNVADVPTGRGVYVILRESSADPSFKATNPVTRRPAYALQRLENKWLRGEHVVYTGKADAADGLRGRLRAFSAQSGSHSGGRALWQLQDAHLLNVAWMATASELGEAVERRFLHDFRLTTGRYPFANWRG